MEERLLPINEILPGVKDWKCRVRVIKKLAAKQASNSPNKFQKLILGDGLVSSCILFRFKLLWKYLSPVKYDITVDYWFRDAHWMPWYSMIILIGSNMCFKRVEFTWSREHMFLIQSNIRTQSLHVIINGHLEETLQSWKNRMIQYLLVDYVLEQRQAASSTNTSQQRHWSVNISYLIIASMQMIFLYLFQQYSL